jgi:leucyl/phenylalanyl-tRNA--protein transferase
MTPLPRWSRTYPSNGPDPAVSWPREPEPSRFVFDLTGVEPGQDLVGVGADLEAGTLLSAYRSGLFPMGAGPEGGGPLGWWSPDPRGILPVDGMRISRSLRRSCSRFEIRVDTDFVGVIAGCADGARPGRWIRPEIIEAYVRLHRLGWAHSIECWQREELVGGLYGVSIGGLFAGESMFYRRTDASKVALVALTRLCGSTGEDDRLLDIQWTTPHLISLGAVDLPRRDYLRRLSRVLAAEPPSVFVDPAPTVGLTAM